MTIIVEFIDLNKGEHIIIDIELIYFRRGKMRGLTFEIPNEYAQLLSDILVGIIDPSWYWRVGEGESYLVKNNTLDSELFPSIDTMDGQSFINKITADKYYLISADLKAFPNQKEVKQVLWYEDFLNSECQFIFLLIDCSYVSIFAKNLQMIDQFYERAVANGYKNIKFIINENDHTYLTV
ncbi:hypothetical protein UACE39S_03715 [Ureibacillus acetophenoni]